MSFDTGGKPPLAGAELEPGELRQLVGGRIGQPTCAPRPDKPHELASSVGEGGTKQHPLGGTRPCQVGPLRRCSRIEEPPEGALERVGVGVAHLRFGLVTQAETGQQHSDAPLLVLAHHEVVGERELLPDVARYGRVDVRKQRGLQGELRATRHLLLARLGAVQEAEEVALRRPRVGQRGLQAETPARCGLGPAEPPFRQPVLVLGVGVLTGEDQNVARAILAPRLRARPWLNSARLIEWTTAP